MVPPGGRHLIVEFSGVHPEILKDARYLEAVLCESAIVSNATILHRFFHHFGEEYGVTGVVALAESHISIHTWPEEGYAALDIFMCGKCDPNLSFEYITKQFNPGKMVLKVVKRGP